MLERQSRNLNFGFFFFFIGDGWIASSMTDECIIVLHHILLLEYICTASPLA